MINKENEILLNYQKYDFLNTENSYIKILVNYIKPSFLFKSNILTPIQLGKAVETQNSKDGIQNGENLEWLHKNCEFNDDFASGISKDNRRIGFLTGTYWAWKNYDKLGNPEYFGSFGYRRVFNPNFLKEIKKNYDIILPQKRNLNIVTVKEQFSNYHGEDLFKRMTDTFTKIYPSETEELTDYFNNTSGYFDEIYVMKKEIFFKFCEWIFPLVFEFLKTPQIILQSNDLRDIGFIMERLTGYYCNKLASENKKIYHTNVEITEKLVMNKNNIDTKLLASLRKKVRT